MLRWKRFLLTLVIGLLAGLIYGWLVSPLELVDTTPDMLSADYRTDIVLMVAEIHAAAADPGSSRQVLVYFFPQSPGITATEALAYASAVGYAQPDLSLLLSLSRAMPATDPGVSP